MKLIEVDHWHALIEHVTEHETRRAPPLRIELAEDELQTLQRLPVLARLLARHAVAVRAAAHAVGHGVAARASAGWPRARPGAGREPAW